MKAILIVVMLLVTGCGSRAYYNEQQSANRSKCYQLPPSQINECLQHTFKTFDEYERERKLLIDE